MTYTHVVVVDVSGNESNPIMCEKFTSRLNGHSRAWAGEGSVMNPVKWIVDSK